MQSGKPQFGQWLIDQVGSGQYEGLCWIDHKKFRIPWKHNSRKDCSDEDSKIFKAWAVASGKIADNPHDKAKWKTNFRCALRGLKQFHMVEDRSKESDDPHKVYLLTQSEYNYENQDTNDIPINVGNEIIPDIFIPENQDVQQELLNHLDTLNLNNQQPEEYQCYGHYAHNVPDVERGLSGQPMPVETHLHSQNNLSVSMQPSHCTENLDAMACLPVQPSINDLEITVHYRRKEMVRALLSSPLVQLHHQCDDLVLGAQPIGFPGVEHMLDKQQAKYTARILNSIRRGLLLEVCETGIYGLRQDNCQVFASTTDPTQIQQPVPNKLPQNCRVQLLSFEKYAKELTEFSENKRGSPDYTINLCFGQKFPDGKPMEKKLITVKVTPLICRYFHEASQLEGASSLQNDTISLQISNNSLFDLIHSTFGLTTSIS